MSLSLFLKWHEFCSQKYFSTISSCRGGGGGGEGGEMDLCPDVMRQHSLAAPLIWEIAVNQSLKYLNKYIVLYNIQ